MNKTWLSLTLAATAGLCSMEAAAAPTFGALNLRGGLAALLVGTPEIPGGVDGAVPFLLKGDTLHGLGEVKGGVSATLKVLTQDTPRLQGLAMGLDTLVVNTVLALEPLNLKIDPVLMKVAEPLAPITEPVGTQVVNVATLLATILTAPGFGVISFGNALPGMEGVSMNQ